MIKDAQHFSGAIDNDVSISVWYRLADTVIACISQAEYEIAGGAIDDLYQCTLGAEFTNMLQGVELCDRNGTIAGIQALRDARHHETWRTIGYWQFF